MAATISPTQNMTPTILKEKTFPSVNTNTPIPLSPIPPTATPLLFPLPNQTIIELFKSNGNCDSPCLWGIVPERTHLDQVLIWTKDLDLELSNTTPNHYSFGYGNEEHPKISVVLEVDEDVVSGLNAIIYGILSPTIDRNDYDAFLPETIMKKYGKPSLIILDTENAHELNAPQDKVLYDYTFFYNDQNLVIQYSGGPIEGEKSDYYTLCPAKENLDSIRIWLGHDQNGIPSKAFFPKLEEAASISVDDFYRMYIEAPLTFCMQLKASVFKD
jgi:hypothetical protein